MREKSCLMKAKLVKFKAALMEVFFSPRSSPLAAPMKRNKNPPEKIRKTFKHFKPMELIHPKLLPSPSPIDELE